MKKQIQMAVLEGTQTCCSAFLISQAPFFPTVAKLYVYQNDIKGILENRHFELCFKLILENLHSSAHLAVKYIFFPQTHISF